MDSACGLVASRIAKGPVATVAIESMTFIAPILLRDIISVYAAVIRTGRTSIAVHIEVFADRNNGEHVKVTEGIFTFVALDDNRSEEHTSELQSLMRISYAVFCLKKNTKLT